MSDPEHYAEIREIRGIRGGHDSTPLVALVPEDPYRRGSITSQARTASEQYQAFLKRSTREAKQ